MFYYKHHDMFNHDRGNSLIPFFLSTNASPYNLQVRVAATQHPFDVNGNPQPPAPLTSDQLTLVKNIFGTPPTGTTGLAPVSDFIFSPVFTTVNPDGTLSFSTKR